MLNEAGTALAMGFAFAPISLVINAPTVIRAKATGETVISIGGITRPGSGRFPTPTISVGDSNPNAKLDLILTVNYGTLWGLTLGLRGRLEVETGSKIELKGTQQQVNALLESVKYTPPDILPPTETPITLTIKATDLTTGITATTTVPIEVL